MKIAEIRDTGGLEALRPEWNVLLSKSASNTVFLTWEWISAWWSNYGEPGGLRIVTARDERDELVAIAPMRLRAEQRYKQRVPMLSFIGDGSNDSDYLDFIAVRGREEEAVNAFHDHFAGSLRPGSVLALRTVPETSTFLPTLKRAAHKAGHSWQETEFPCSIVALPYTWDEYLRLPKPHFRTKIRSVLRNLESRPEVSFGFCRTGEQLEAMLPILFDLHTRRWAEDGEPGVFGSD